MTRKMLNILVHPATQSAIALMALAISIAVILFPSLIPKDQSSDLTLDQRISEIQSSLDQIDDIAQEVQELGQQAIEAERRAADSIAISQLTEEQVRALDSRLNRDQTARDIALLVAGAVLGVVFERLAKLIGWLININLQQATNTDK